MLHRILSFWTVFLGLAGLLVVALMVLFGADLVRAARTGPKWKRALVTAAVSLASVLGFPIPSVQAADPPPAESASVASVASVAVSSVAAVFDLKIELEKLAALKSQRDFNPKTAAESIRKTKACVAILSQPSHLSKLNDAGRTEAKRLIAESAPLIASVKALIPIGTTNLAQTPQWELILDTWRASGTLTTVKGSTGAQRVEMKKKFDLAKNAIGELALAGLISNAEAGLLVIDADVIWSRIIASPPTDYNKTCYEMVYIPPAKRSAQWLGKRLELVKKVAAADKVAPAAIDKVMGNINAHLAVLANDVELKKIRTPAERQAAIKLHDEIAPLIAKIDFKALGGRLGATAGWKTVQTAILAAGPLARTHRSTSAQRVAVTKQMKTAIASIATLTASGLLSAAESELILGELARLKKEIYRDPPTDSKVSCYDMMAPDPVGDATKRLEKRIPLLRKLFDSGKLNPLVAGNVLQSVSADITTIKNAKKAQALRKQAATLLQEIDRKFSRLEK
ncbi:MAG: hypothetical protein HN350_15295 [Phycisphaerales bacterium]|jgi:hypothetical protein|nr:hypothetical protein [Phycisphaerales bacterium]